MTYRDKDGEWEPLSGTEQAVIVLVLVLLDAALIGVGLWVLG